MCPRRLATCCSVEGKPEVKVRMSVNRFEDEYALSAARPWMSPGENEDA